MDSDDLSDWHKKKTKPTVEGVYLCLYPDAKGELKQFFSTWTGTHWTPVSHTVEDQKHKHRRAKKQNIRWRGLTQQAYERAIASLEAQRLAAVAGENDGLKEKIREFEKQRSAGMAEAEGYYLQLLKRCKESARLAAKVCKDAEVNTLASLHPSKVPDGYEAYIYSSDLGPDGLHDLLKSAFGKARGSVAHWEWYKGMVSDYLLNKFESTTLWVEMRTGRTVLDYEGSRAKFSKGVAAKSANGNFGSKG